ncbi:hypothetical protein KY345_06200 [Candidatus Woesearchaeota archaeon]|nr:hypothetical protein [Candidatus Woesearchaeota archaeon]
MNEACIDVLVEKARASEAYSRVERERRDRENKLKIYGNGNGKLSSHQRRLERCHIYSNGHIIRKRHWHNNAGTYRDENRKAPKYFMPSQQPRVLNHIRNHKDLIEALKIIAAGQADHDCYRNVSGLDRERLRHAQSQRDKGERINPYEIARMGYVQLKAQRRCN